MPAFLADVWSCCRQQAEAGALSHFSIRLFDEFNFHFRLCAAWPADKIKKSLSFHVPEKQIQAKGWTVYGLTNDIFDCTAYVDLFARDQHGQMDLGEPHVTAAYDAMHGICRVYDFANRRAAIIYPGAHHFTEWEMHSPFREFWHFWALENNAMLIHSGIVAHGNVAVLMPGAGGSGKSTTVLSCLQAGMTTTGDDYNLLMRKNGALHACGLYANMKQKLPKAGGPSFDFPLTRGWDSEPLPYGDKVIYYPPGTSPVWNTSYPQIVGILCPQIAKTSAPQSQPIKTVELINRLAVSSIMQSPYMAKRFLSAAAALTRQVPAEILSLSVNPEANAAYVRAWLEKAEVALCA